MWTVIRFTLSDSSGYPTAFEILRHAGFRTHQAHDSPRPCAVFPAAAVGDVLQDPAVVARAVFEAFAEARLRPVAVSGCEATPPRSPRPLARSG
jgi:hypothetical protein